MSYLGWFPDFLLMAFDGFPGSFRSFKRESKGDALGFAIFLGVLPLEGLPAGGSSVPSQHRERLYDHVWRLFPCGLNIMVDSY